MAETSARTSELLGADEVTPLIGLRAEDASFVLDQLSRSGAVPESLRESMDLTRVGMFGHSAGGAAALQVARDRDEVVAALNLDGFARQPSAANGLDEPFLFVTSDGHSEATEPTWGPFLDASGAGRIVEVAGAGHLALTDVGSDGWIDGLGLEQIVPPEAFTTNFGNLAPGTMAAIAQGITSFFEETLRDRRTAGFDELHISRPDIIETVTEVP